MRSAAMPPTLSKEEQARAFEAFATAKHALRSHLHGCDSVAQHITSRAKAAASGAKGTKNNAKKYFAPGGPTWEAVQIQQCRFETISLASPMGSQDDVNLTFGDTLIDYDAQIPGADYMDCAA